MFGSVRESKALSIHTFIKISNNNIFYSAYGSSIDKLHILLKHQSLKINEKPKKAIMFITLPLTI